MILTNIDIFLILTTMIIAVIVLVITGFVFLFILL